MILPGLSANDNEPTEEEEDGTAEVEEAVDPVPSVEPAAAPEPPADAEPEAVNDDESSPTVETVNEEDEDFDKEDESDYFLSPKFDLSDYFAFEIGNEDCIVLDFLKVKSWMKRDMLHIPSFVTNIKQINAQNDLNQWKSGEKVALPIIATYKTALQGCMGSGLQLLEPTIANQKQLAKIRPKIDALWVYTREDSTQKGIYLNMDGTFLFLYHKGRSEPSKLTDRPDGHCLVFMVNEQTYQFRNCIEKASYICAMSFSRAENLRMIAGTMEAVKHIQRRDYLGWFTKLREEIATLPVKPCIGCTRVSVPQLSPLYNLGLPITDPGLEGLRVRIARVIHNFSQFSALANKPLINIMKAFIDGDIEISREDGTRMAVIACKRITKSVLEIVKDAIDEKLENGIGVNVEPDPNYFRNTYGIITLLNGIVGLGSIILTLTLMAAYTRQARRRRESEVKGIRNSDRLEKELRRIEFLAKGVIKKPMPREPQIIPAPSPILTHRKEVRVDVHKERSPQVPVSKPSISDRFAKFWNRDTTEEKAVSFSDKSEEDVPLTQQLAPKSPWTSIDSLPRTSGRL